MNESIEYLGPRLTSQEFSGYIVYILHYINLKKNIPPRISKGYNKGKFTNLIREEETQDLLDDFFGTYIDSVKNIDELHEISDNFERNLKEISNPNGGKEIKDILGEYIKIITDKIELLEKNSNKPTSVPIKEVVNETPKLAEQAMIKKEPSKNIYLKNGELDFDVWKNVYENCIVFFEKIMNTNGLKSEKKFQKFTDSLKPENRGNFNVFIKIDDFLKHFGFIEFYKYILKLLEKSPQKEILAQAILEHFPIFEINSSDNKKFLDLQKQILDKAQELTNGNAK